MTTWFDKLPRNRLLAEFSLWSADLSRLADEMARVDQFVDIYHIDVSDGHFTPAFLFFPDQVNTLRKHSARPFHVHLMTKDEILLEQIAQFADAGADLISVHVENSNCEEALAAIAKRGIKAGVVLKVDTPVQFSAAIIDQISVLTLLGTSIGVKGQSLDERATLRLAEAKLVIGARNVILAADGGIRESTVPLLRKAGAQTVVMGSLAFGASDLPARVAWIRSQ